MIHKQHWATDIAWFCAWMVVVGFVILALGCGVPETRVDTRTTTNIVAVPTPINCADPADVPTLPTRTPVDAEKATTDQLAAATVADVEKLEPYAKAADKFMKQCARAIQPTGGVK